MTKKVLLYALVLGVVQGISSDDANACMTVSADEAAMVTAMREEAVESGDKDHLKMMQVKGLAITTPKSVDDAAFVSDKAEPLAAVQESAKDADDSQWYGGTTIYHHHGYGGGMRYGRYRRYGRYGRGGTTIYHHHHYGGFGGYGRGGTTIVHHHHYGGFGWLQEANAESPEIEEGQLDEEADGEDTDDAEGVGLAALQVKGQAITTPKSVHDAAFVSDKEEPLAAVQESAKDADDSEWGYGGTTIYHHHGYGGGMRYGRYRRYGRYGRGRTTIYHHHHYGGFGGYGRGGTTIVHHHHYGGFGWLQEANAESPVIEDGQLDEEADGEDTDDAEGEGGLAALQDGAEVGGENVAEDSWRRHRRNRRHRHRRHRRHRHHRRGW